MKRELLSGICPDSEEDASRCGFFRCCLPCPPGRERNPAGRFFLAFRGSFALRCRRAVEPCSARCRQCS